MENTSSLWRHHPAPKTLFLCEVYSNILKECEYTSQRRQLRCVFNAFSLSANYPLQIKPETSPLPLPALQYNPCSPTGARERCLKGFNVVPPARVLLVQNSQGMVSCRGVAPRKKRIRATTRDAGYCQSTTSRQQTKLRITHS